MGLMAEQARLYMPWTCLPALGGCSFINESYPVSCEVCDSSNPTYAAAVAARAAPTGASAAAADDVRTVLLAHARALEKGTPSGDHALFFQSLNSALRPYVAGLAPATAAALHQARWQAVGWNAVTDEPHGAEPASTSTVLDFVQAVLGTLDPPTGPQGAGPERASVPEPEPEPAAGPAVDGVVKFYRRDHDALRTILAACPPAECASSAAALLMRLAPPRGELGAADITPALEVAIGAWSEHQRAHGKESCTSVAALFAAIARWALDALRDEGAPWGAELWPEGGGPRRAVYSASQCRGILANALLMNVRDTTPVRREKTAPTLLAVLRLRVRPFSSAAPLPVPCG